MNAIMRFKLALTEEVPTIKPYYEDRWAELPDAHYDEVEDSIQLLKALHKRWGWLLRELSTEDLKKEFLQPEHNRRFNLAEAIGNYAWHSNHHLAHVKNGLKSEGRYLKA